MAIRSSDRAKISRQYEIWSEEHGTRLCAQAMLAFLDSIDLLDEEKVRGYLKTIRKDNLSYTGIKKFEPSEVEPKERRGKKR